MIQSLNNTADSQDSQIYVMKLYVADSEQNSQFARKNLDKICKEYLKGRCQILEIDVLKDFESALADKVFVTPCLILVEPSPRVVIVGHLGDKERVISGLGLKV